MTTLDGYPTGRTSIYPDAFDLFEMLSTPCPINRIGTESCDTAHSGVTDLPNARDGPDVRLSTAALTSARYPIVSPPGMIRAKNHSKIGSAVVNGGYFENAGLRTAMDIAKTLAHFGITPIVLWVQNSPSPEGVSLVVQSLLPPRAGKTPKLNNLPDIVDNFGSITSTLLNTVSAYQTEETEIAQHSLDNLNRRVNEEMEQRVKRDEVIMAGNTHKMISTSWFTFNLFQYPRFGKARNCAVFAESPKLEQVRLNDVSMSWWLSYNTQAELDLQVCDERNQKGFDDLMNRLSQSLPVVVR
jgi:hypothetical protein